MVKITFCKKNGDICKKNGDICKNNGDIFFVKKTVTKKFVLEIQSASKAIA